MLFWILYFGMIDVLGKWDHMHGLKTFCGLKVFARFMNFDIPRTTDELTESPELHVTLKAASKDLQNLMPNYTFSEAYELNY